MNKAFSKKYTFEEAIELIKNAVAPLGEEYVALIQRAYDERWIDSKMIFASALRSFLSVVLFNKW